MAQIEVTEESLHRAVDEAVFAQAVTLADKVAGFSAVGPQIEAIVDGIEVSVRVKPFGLDARCACPAAPHPGGAPCAHAVAAGRRRIQARVMLPGKSGIEMRAEIQASCSSCDGSGQRHQVKTGGAALFAGCDSGASQNANQQARENRSAHKIARKP